MAMINPVNETLKKFQTLMAENDDNPSREQIAEYVYQNFKAIGELDEEYPRDFKKEPKIIKEIADPVVRHFAQHIIDIWPTLTRKVSYHVLDHPDTHSLIPVEHPFIIPGGRFKEYYYWDSYWILKGLLLSDMYETSKGLVQNLLSMVIIMYLLIIILYLVLIQSTINRKLIIYKQEETNTNKHLHKDMD